MVEDFSAVSPYTHVVSAKQFSKDFLSSLFTIADDIRSQPKAYQDTLRGKVIAALFYEPSTRTRLSFETAVQRLGGNIITAENAGEFSSAVKGETLEDSIRIVSAYADMIVMRHPADDAGERAARVASIPFISAGSGKTHHPTQALLDIYTIHRELGRTNTLKVGIVGDLLRGRTVDSLVQVLSQFEGNEFVFVAPENSRVKDAVKQMLEEKDIAFVEEESLEAILPELDVLYVTRVQKERFDDEAEYKKAAGAYVLTDALANRMKNESIIMHPLPRIDEIAVDVDANPRAKYFDQAANGLWVRMALLTMLAKGE